MNTLQFIRGRAGIAYTITSRRLLAMPATEACGKQPRVTEGPLPRNQRVTGKGKPGKPGNTGKDGSTGIWNWGAAGKGLAAGMLAMALAAGRPGKPGKPGKPAGMP